MLFTGQNDFSKHQARNFGLEQVAVLPTFLPEDYGRILYVTTIGPNFGVWIGGPLGWQKIASTLPQMLKEVEYSYHGLSTISPIGIEISEITGIVQDAVVPATGELVMVSITIEPALTAGSITIIPTINGSDIIASSELNTVFIPGTDFRTARLTSSNPAYKANQGDRVGLRAYGNLASLPTLVNLMATVFITLPIVISIGDAYDSFDFAHWKVLQSQVKNMYPYVGIAPGKRAAQNGYLIAMTAQLNIARTSGIITIVPTINGAPVLDPSLNLTLDNTNPQGHYASIDVDLAFAFNEGDLLGAQLATDNLLVPEPVDLMSRMSVLYPL